jgi:AcrR family transcriptional regulator
MRRVMHASLALASLALGRIRLRQTGSRMASDATAVSRNAGVPGPVQGKATQTREAILAAAARLFREEGYHATTLRQIAAAARMEAGSVYYHFESKDAILDEVLRIGVRQVLGAVQQTREENGRLGVAFRRAFALMIGAHLRSILNESDFTSANIRNYSRLPGSWRARHRPLRRAYAALWDEFLEEARANGEIRPDLGIAPLRQFVLGAMNWMIDWDRKDRPATDILAARLADLLLDGMLAKAAEPLSPPLPLAIDMAAVEDDGSKALRTRAQLLSAAAHVFRERGYKATTMRDIAKTANIKAGSIYYHFLSKSEIVVEVLDIGLRHLLRAISDVLSDHRSCDCRSRIAAAIRVHLEYLFRLSDFTSANIRTYGQLPNDIRARHRPLRNAYASIWEELLREAQTAGVVRRDIEATPLRQTVLGALNWTVEWFDSQRHGSGCYGLSELISIAQTVLLDGLAQPPAGAGTCPGNKPPQGAPRAACPGTDAAPLRVPADRSSRSAF